MTLQTFRKKKPLDLGFFSAVLVIALGFFIPTQAQQLPGAGGELRDGTYVVIGAFRVHDNAVNFMERVRKMGYEPQYALRPSNRLYHVYLQPGDMAATQRLKNELRKKPEFYDAWVLVYRDGRKEESASETGETPDEIIAARPAEIPVEQAADQPEAGVEVPVAEEPKAPERTAPDGDLIGISMKERKKEVPVLFNAVNARTLREVQGYITLVDAERDRAMRQVGTNMVHLVEPPDTQTERMLAIADVFGFQKQQVEFVPANPLASPDADVIRKVGDTVAINYELVRYPVGSILTMYNVYFYNDASVMKPESRFELNSLLDMLKENPNLKIRIHGHTNSNAAGKIIRLKEDDDHFFEVTGNNIEEFGSAKKLSMERAKTIRKWLVRQGIEEGRMTLKAWGGKKMLYDKTDPLARRNVRVDIEILRL
jgi:outer membrane protein OmpA-like peptidoglycan-associated protein